MTAYVATVRLHDLRRLQRELNRISGDWLAIRDAALTLVGFASVEPEPDACKACGEHVSAPHSPQCPEDALNRIAEEWESQRQDDTTALRRIAAILRETGRLPELQ